MLKIFLYLFRGSKFDKISALNILASFTKVSLISHKLIFHTNATHGGVLVRLVCFCQKEMRGTGALKMFGLSFTFLLSSFLKQGSQTRGPQNVAPRWI